MNTLRLVLIVLASCFMLQGCGTINAGDQELDNPTVGTAQTGDPALIDHRN
ncbi:MAG: hypothetical protein K2X04_02210 [Burkholderiales bacterium]|jgi:hypothetical protein|nr:hypothetical protein [Burkholderiales bacterium]